MGRKSRSKNRRYGTPTWIVLYRTPERWRFALYLRKPDGIADGALADLPPSCPLATAQAAVKTLAEEFGGQEIDDVTWKAAGPDWWTGEVTATGTTRDGDPPEPSPAD